MWAPKERASPEEGTGDALTPVFASICLGLSEIQEPKEISLSVSSTKVDSSQQNA